MLLFSPVVLAAAAVVLLVIFVTRRISSPLWKVPGPVVSGFTSLELKYNELKANRTLYVHGLHVKYGPVVRIAPNEVSFTSWAALKEIYTSGGSGYDKTEFYDLFKIYGRRTMFTTLNKADVSKAGRVSFTVRLTHHSMRRESEFSLTDMPTRTSCVPHPSAESKNAPRDSSSAALAQPPKSRTSSWLCMRTLATA